MLGPPFRTRTDIWPSMMFAMDVTEPIGCSSTDIFFVKHKSLEIRLKSSFILKSCKPVIGVYGGLLPDKLHLQVSCLCIMKQAVSLIHCLKTVYYDELCNTAVRTSQCECFKTYRYLFPQFNTNSLAHLVLAADSNICYMFWSQVVFLPLTVIYATCSEAKLC